MKDVDDSFRATMTERFGEGRLRSNMPLAPFTTFKVGGPAEWFLETVGEADIVDALRIAWDAKVQVTLLGGGSNVLISDNGVSGLVLRTRGGRIEPVGHERIRVDAAVTINGLVRWTVQRGIAGPEAWAGTPGTIGGAVYGNAHFHGHLIDELIESVRVADRTGKILDLSRDEMDFGYDRSRLQKTSEVLLSALLRVGEGDPAALRAVARESLAFRKRTQPLDTPSAGCVFRNPDAAALPRDVPASAGALVDRVGMKGVSAGGARVSNAHGNFIVNEGHATAAEIRTLIDLCRARVREEFNVTLREEIVYLGSFNVEPAD